MTDYDLVIVGAGPGGYVAAGRAAKLGMKIAVVEKESRLGGVCLNVGCIPSKALLDSSEHYYNAKKTFSEHGIGVGEVSLDLSTMMARKNQVVKDLTEQVAQLMKGNKIDVIHGTGSLKSGTEVAVALTEGGEKTLTAKNILLATGGTPIEVPAMPFDGKHIVSSTEALSFDSVPEHLGVVGGGYIGLELGSVWSRLGAKVTVIEMLPKIVATMDSQIIRTLQRLLKGQGLEFRLSTKVVSAEVADGKVSVEVEKNDKKETLSFDKLLIAVGRRPFSKGLNLEGVGIETDSKSGHVKVDVNYRTTVPTVYAIGDLIPGPALAHKASAEGMAAVEIMAGLPGEVNYDVIPGVVYTWPEGAGVGITEKQARDREIPHSVGTFPFSGSGRARCMGEKDGFVKLICHAKTDRVLGVHILGPRAADMIAEAALAMQVDASAEDIARTVHAHPTFSEAIMDAAHAARK